MDTTVNNTYEVTIPQEYTATLKQFIKALGGKVKAPKKCGLEEALEDIEAGRVNHYSSVDEMWKDLTAK